MVSHRNEALRAKRLSQGRKDFANHGRPPPAKYRTFRESSPDSMMIVERSGRLIAMNAPARDRLRYSKQDVLELDLDALGASAIRERFPEIQRIGRVRLQGILCTKDGTTLKAAFNSVAMGDGSYQFVLGWPESQETSADTLFQLAPEPILELDLAEELPRVLKMNHQATVFWNEGMSEGYQGKELGQLLGLEEASLAELLAWLRTEETGLFEGTWTIGPWEEARRYFKARVARIEGTASSHKRAVLSLCDISAEKLAESAMSLAIQEKNLLLKESQHRSKNNLALLSSMLSLRRQELTDKRCAAELQAAQLRIQAIAHLHDHLMRFLEESLKLELKAFINDIVRTAERAYLSKDSAIKITTLVDDIQIDSKRATSLGLIVNELITNALKYAFKARDQGRVLITTEKTEAELKMMVVDDGVGLPSGFDWRKDGGFGFKFMDILSQQLSATLDVVNEGGLRVSLRIRL